jgi:release factor glutamine methyltransferase
VLIPRPETETLVEEAAARLGPRTRVLDVGAGSGCVAAGLARLLPDARITALEPCPAAAEVARRNLQGLGLAGRTEVIQAAFPLASLPDGAFDAVVSNPPYIPTDDIAALQPEVRNAEPRLALDGGPDGLRILRDLARHSPRLLRRGGLLAVEVAAGQAPAVRALLTAGSWEGVETATDLGGIERVVLARAA